MKKKNSFMLWQIERLGLRNQNTVALLDFFPTFPNCAGFHALLQKKKLNHPEETFTKPTLDDLQDAQ